MGKLIIVLGCVLICVGLLYTYFPQALTWFGNLPGDIKVEKPNSRFYFPITSMIVLSIAFSAIMRLLRHLS